MFNFFTSLMTVRQAFSYALIGILTNIMSYFLYLEVNIYWGEPKISMTVLYFVGALIGFFANRRFTFLHNGRIGLAGVRYLMAQSAGYALNMIILLVFVDCLHYSHQNVQALAILVVAVFLFVVLRVYVFRQTWH